MKKVFKLGCFGIIGLFVLLILVGVLVGDDEGADTGTSTDSAATTSNEPAKKKEEEVVLAKVGEALPVGDVEFMVNGTSTANNVGGTYGVKSQGTFLLVDVTVKNNGNEAITVDSSFFKLKAGEKTYDADSSAGIYANEATEFFMESVNPDLSITGKVVFDVSDEVIANPELLLQVQTGFWGTETGQIKIAK